jgi:hypothetical protein
MNKQSTTTTTGIEEKAKYRIHSLNSMLTAHNDSHNEGEDVCYIPTQQDSGDVGA